MLLYWFFCSSANFEVYHIWCSICRCNTVSSRLFFSTSLNQYKRLQKMEQCVTVCYKWQRNYILITSFHSVSTTVRGSVKNFHWGRPTSQRVWGRKSPSRVQGRSLVGGLGAPEAEAVCRHGYRFWLQQKWSKFGEFTFSFLASMFHGGAKRHLGRA